MPTVHAHLNWIQSMLGDTAQPGVDGPLWSRQSLRELFCNGYRALLTQTQAVKRWVILEVPGDFTMTGTAEWEAHYANGGSFQVVTLQAPGGYACTSSWEVEWLEGRSTGIDVEGGMVTQPWERVYLNPAETPYRFALPRDSERVEAMYYDHRRLMVLETRELDELWRDWRSLGSYPLTWTLGTGRTRTFEVYEIVTVDQTVYVRQGSDWGIPRNVSGARQYQAAVGNLWGIPRHIESPNRQYLATMGVWGTPREYHSSVGNLLILEVVGPEVPDLLEGDTPDLIPPQMERYLRYYTLAQACSAQGEGRQEALAALCMQVFEHGVQRLRTLGWLTRKDQDVQRGMPNVGLRQKYPRVQLPPNYPRVRW